jgi:hypothetical protein
VPVAIPEALEAADSGVVLARSLAPLLYVRRDEWFPLERAAGRLVPDPSARSRSLLCRDDAEGDACHRANGSRDCLDQIRYSSCSDGDLGGLDGSYARGLDGPPVCVEIDVESGT